MLILHILTVLKTQPFRNTSASKRKLFMTSSGQLPDSVGESLAMFSMNQALGIFIRSLYLLANKRKVSPVHYLHVLDQLFPLTSLPAVPELK